ncbi:DEAD-box ATP-dependent RNA helicase 14 [Turnera subulata]|uniref:RNA helicase n=1 Tax=Turnera subulata TaxID=218843 RepID=A0A9Q0FIU0_9ROSI|nr:DEAD-box ATP-dependent RNA helicase 14 [Turnera subulata]
MDSCPGAESVSPGAPGKRRQVSSGGNSTVVESCSSVVTARPCAEARGSIAMAATAAGPRYAPEDPTLPKPWKGLVDGKTGYIYFWNPETNVTQYERPAGSVKSSSVPVSSSVQVQQSSRRGYSPVKEDDRYGPKSDAGMRSSQSGRGGLDHSQHVSTGTANGSLGSSARGYGSSGGSALSAEAYRRRHEISVTGDEVPPPLTSFEATGFPSELLREVRYLLPGGANVVPKEILKPVSQLIGVAGFLLFQVQNAGFSAPTPIQAQSWPIALQNRDIVAIAKTGSGKTLGYLIPGFIHLKNLRNNPQMGPTVLVLSPTRELATQIQDEAVKFGRSSRISCTCLYGGAPKGPQLRDLDRGTDIVVATPGRLNDILEMRRISLAQVSYLVLDEADRMLDMGFEPQIRKIVKEVPARRQTLMYTATWPREVRKIAADLLVNPVQVNIGNVDELVANKSITQHVELLAPMEKHRRLEQILRSQEPGSKIIIFCSTKKMCDQLARNLTRQFGAAAIHGDKSQGERDFVLNQFRNGRSPVLVATDVAARGLDIKDIRVVINYDFPTGVEDYVHRIGRTGRAGATGLAYTFFGDQDAKYASDLIKVLEGANQRVPPEIRDMASRSGGMGGRSRRWGSGSSGRDGGRGGRSDFGYGDRDGGRGSWGMSSSSFNRPERSGGRGYEPESNRFDRGYGDGYDGGRGRSPDRGSSWSDRSKTWNRDRSRSRSPGRFDKAPPTRERSPVRSFHQAMMERDHKSRSPLGGNSTSFHRAMTERGGRVSPPSQIPHDRSRSPYVASNGGSFHKAMMERSVPSSHNSLPGSRHNNDKGSGDGPRPYFGEEEEEGMIPAEEGNKVPSQENGVYRVPKDEPNGTN